MTTAKKVLLWSTGVLVALGAIGALAGEPTPPTPLKSQPRVTEVAEVKGTTYEAPPTTVDNAISEMLAWINENGSTPERLGELMSKVSDAASTGDIDAVQRTCLALQSGIRSAQAEPPIPDSAINAEYSAALADFSRAASLCLRTAATGDADYFSLAGDALISGSSHMDNATALLESFTSDHS